MYQVVYAIQIVVGMYSLPYILSILRVIFRYEISFSNSLNNALFAIEYI